MSKELIINKMNGVILCKKKNRQFLKHLTLPRMQEVVINPRTKIYIAVGADPEEARSRYWARQDAKGKVLFTPKKAQLVSLNKEVFILILSSIF